MVFLGLEESRNQFVLEHGGNGRLVIFLTQETIQCTQNSLFLLGSELESYG